ncbi:MarR family winged helix-turn-helix transcriptional regulator [Streptomyces nitrosporeus]|uniref:MarR family transcriptional regulator n=1 Tax=Streptomyces nitrosporeus TaxID=28894 RepID=A0A5J6FI14_9ACTN|nr:MarR family winged helix-turn-helix transcriptional regulator [Streptomyces nitrosporeus]QEU76008.1 MarR family transcriptional regulator [Streptomyces nitrosporeus]GGZ24046.1 hypothetical protein GCM10010327_63600 [Streptomyces nitrosporeus]
MTDAPPNMPYLLGEARRWFDDALLAGLRAAGEQPITATQAAVFAALDADGASISELARRMGVTRQTAHQAVHSLIGMGLLEQTPDPASARSSVVRRTEQGARTHRRAEAMLARAEEILAERIGPGARDLRAVLSRPWGEPPVVLTEPGGS